MSVYKILLGSNPSSPNFSFEDNQIESINEEKAIGIIGEELTIDTFEAVVRYNGDSFVPKINSLYGTPIYYYHNNVLIDKFYVDTIERESRNKYTLHGISAIGLLETKKHYGGVYFGETFQTVLNSILNGTLSTNEYSIATGIPGIPVYGRLPYDTARSNLHKLLMAYNVTITKDSNGLLKFEFLNINATAQSISSNYIYEDGDSEYGKMPTSIEITEYAYIPWEEGMDEKSLYDTSSDGRYADNQFVEFGDPIIPSTLRTDSSSLSIISSSANHAVVTGKGILYGIPYGVRTKVHKYSTGFSGKENVVSITNNTLITFQNCYDISERLKDYYGHTTTYTMNTIEDIPNVGGKYTFTNSFGEQTTGILSKMSKEMSSNIKSECDIVSGLTHYGVNRIYSNRQLLTDSGNWTIPSGVTHVMIVLIGGGCGGDSGYSGENGSDASQSSGGKGGSGGAGGDPGLGGDIYTFELDVTPLRSISYTCGSGGAGGNGTASEVDHDNNDPGEAGGATSVTYNSVTYSTSVYGYPSSCGFCDYIYNGGTSYIIYGKPSVYQGLEGGEGGEGGSYYSGDSSIALSDVVDYGIYGSSGQDLIGYNEVTYSGGENATLTTDSVTIIQLSSGTEYNQEYTFVPYSENGILTYYGHRFHGTGGGGGAAEGLNGYDSEGTSISGQLYMNYFGTYTGSAYLNMIVGESGMGGIGATPSGYTSSVTRTYGDGGRGGSGGGGGGGGGAFGPLSVSDSVSYSSGSGSSKVTENYYGLTQYQCPTGYLSLGGAGGAAGNGQDGMPGCVLIYY